MIAVAVMALALIPLLSALGYALAGRHVVARWYFASAVAHAAWVAWMLALTAEAAR